MLEYLLFFGGGEEGGDLFGALWPMLLFVPIIWMMMRSKRKQERFAQEIRSSLEVGDEIVTVGGILGRVVSVRDDSLLIETGSANTKMRITRQAVQTNLTSHERRQEAAQALSEEKAKRKAEKAGKSTDS